MKIKLHMDGDVMGASSRLKEMDKEGLTSKQKKLNHNESRLHTSLLETVMFRRDFSIHFWCGSCVRD